MPGKVGVKIKAGRNLPVMDRGSDTTDAYVEIKLGNTTHKTDVCRKSLNPQFNTDWFRFEVDDAELQDEPLQIRLMDHDTYSANDAIGKVNISLSPLCLDTAGQTTYGKNTVLSGWIPVFDTMHGIRGEVHIIVKVDLFSDLNKFRQSSCGLPFFHSPCVPYGYRAQIIHGFVEELVVNDDPEYQWIDKIRTPRASNEARQSVFLQLSGQVQRKMGIKAINMGANAIIGYTQCFDLEGDVGVVVRGIGTAVTLIKDVSAQPIVTTSTENALIEECHLKAPEESHRLLDKSSALPSSEKFKYEIQKSLSHGIIFDRGNSLDAEDDRAEMMLELMRQEDERGERPAPKLKQQMRRFTRSSRNLFNEKYAAIKRKMGDSMGSKSPDSVSMHSFSSISSNYRPDALTSYLTKSESSSSARSSIFDSNFKHPRQSFKAKRRPRKSKSPNKLQPPTITIPHSMVRSISDDSSVKKSEAQKMCIPRIAVISEFQENARSSPDFFASETSNKKLFELGPPEGQEYCSQYDLINDCSSVTLSDSVSSSSSDDSYNFEYPSGKVANEKQSHDEATEKLEKLLKIIDEEENVNENWIKPGQGDESFPEITEEHPSCAVTILNDLKAFSHQLQDKIKRKKSTKSNEKEPTSTRRTPPNNLLLNPLAMQDRKSYYSSHPEILQIAPDTNKLAIPSDQFSSSPLKQTRSLLDLQSMNNPTKASFPGDSAATTDNLPDRYSINLNNASRCNIPPILQICPSTPTPSESENSQLTPNDEGIYCSQSFQEDRFACNLNLDSIRTPNCGSMSCVNSNDIFPNNQSKNNCPPFNYDQYLEDCSHCKTSTTNQTLSINNNIDKNSLLAPSFCITTSTCNTTMPNVAATNIFGPKSPTIRKHPNQHHRHHHHHQHFPHQLNRNHHHRSLNELNATNGGAATTNTNIAGRTDSPSMKRFASPASAAVVAAASNVSTVDATITATSTSIPTTTTPSVASATSAATATSSSTESQFGSRSKLTPSPSKMQETTSSGNLNAGDNLSSTTTTSTSTTSAATMIQKDVGEIYRRSSDSDLSVTPKGNSICVASERLVAATAMMRLTQPVSSKNVTGATTESMDSMLEYPFLTMTKYPTGFILHLGATVAARSVKLLERVPNPDEPEIRDSWWTELRMEIRSHARALGCNVVLGYSETTTISDDVCVLSATGTAAVINMAYNRSISQQDIYTAKTSVSGSGTGAGAIGGGGMSTSLEERDMLKDTRNGLTGGGGGGDPTKDSTGTISSSYGGSGQNIGSSLAGRKHNQLPPLAVPKSSANCTICHVPYNLTTVPFNVKMKKCIICRKGRVPDVLLATLEVPEFVQVTGRGCFMQAQVVRPKKDLRSELNAKEISDGLPFLEYELHRVLINKLKAKGMNAIFGLRTQVSIGERMIALIATGTALFLSALPMPQVPRIVAGNSWTDKQKLNELQKKLQETYERNQEIYQLKGLDQDLTQAIGNEAMKQPNQSDTDESDDEVIEIDLNCGNKDACVLEVDDIEDLEIISLLMEPYPPEGFHVVNTETVPGMVEMEAVKNLQMFTQIWRAKLDIGQTINGFPKHFQRLVQTICFKLRTMAPCSICDLRFRLDLAESDQIQLLVTGMALGLADVSGRHQKRKKQNLIGANTVANNIKIAKTNGTANPPSDGSESQQVCGGNVGGGIGNKRPLQEEDYIFPLDEDQMVETPTPTSNMPPYGTHSFKLRKTSPSRIPAKTQTSLRNRYVPIRDRSGVDITPLSFIPGGRIEKYLGNLNFFFIRESTSIRENGGMSGFVHSFVTELLAVVRANIAALGGNAMVSFYMNELILVDNQHKNQGQCLISVGGDAIYVSYYNDE